MTNNLISHYVVRPTEPDGAVSEYRFGTAAGALDYIADTLVAEYGFETSDVDGTDIYGYCAGDDCAGHVIGSVVAVPDARNMAALRSVMGWPALDTVSAIG